MTTIAVLGNFTGTDVDFSRAVTSFGGIALVTGSTVVPAATAADAYVLLAPFVLGTKFKADNASFHCADLDTGTNVQLDIGVVFADSTADIPTLFRSLSNVPQTGGFVTLTNTEWMNQAMPANGWVVARIKTAPTTTAGAITFNYGVSF